MSEHATLLIALGALLLLGMATDGIGKLTRLPRVTLLLLFGFAVGPGGLDLLPDRSEQWFELITTIALTMIGFLLGGKLSRQGIFRHGRAVMGYSVLIALLTSGGVIIGLLLLNTPPPLAVLLGAIAAATDPATTIEVIRESGKDNRITRTLLGIVAVDDAWGLIIFSVALAVAAVLTGNGSLYQSILHGVWDIGGALLLGLAIGIPAALLTGRLRPGEPTILEALGVVILCAGLTDWLEVSPFLAAMTLGMVIVNLARHHTRPFHVIDDFDRPFLVLFFVLAGAQLELLGLLEIGLLGSAYVLLRVVSRFAGAWSAGAWLHTPVNESNRLALSLMPQAGVAMGMGLVAAERYPEFSETLISVVIGSTVLFEILGPILTRRALQAETGKRSSE
ncbi:cation:proton antiporter [Thiohalophilus thiocyanatoxydans]|uniref:Transporter (CPA2 family) n=1 Tax=Thiohalophilus thiocyanatoxydans TaxID=381308 RepID=A0A4R8INJ9_9GAMM|nr:cation:proton antiporter [Thiohalophilus thiocyanatoxydans]TDY02446.1 transporter (CPA2 family) [Thiohalophilus thiocyanatoxydans]